MPYIWPDNYLFGLEEATYNLTYREQRNDITKTERLVPVLRISTIRTNITFQNLKFQSIMLDS